MKSRLALADQLFIQATGFSEIEIRSSLSRLYYASFHVAVVLTGGKGHSDVSRKLADDYGEIGQELKDMHELRSRMDYDPGFFSASGISDLGLWYQERLREGTSLYYRLRDALERRDQEQ